MYSFRYVLALACIVFFYKAGEQDDGDSGGLWALLSFMISLVILIIGFEGWLPLIGSQLGLLVVIALIRVFRE